jgi:hypothetical protein
VIFHLTLTCNFVRTEYLVTDLISEVETVAVSPLAVADMLFIDLVSNDEDTTESPPSHVPNPTSSNRNDLTDDQLQKQRHCHSESEEESGKRVEGREFALFSTLPAELRARVWKFALPMQPNRVHLTLSQGSEGISENFIPATYFVNTESRAETLRHYKLFERTMRPLLEIYVPPLLIDPSNRSALRQFQQLYYRG